MVMCMAPLLHGQATALAGMLRGTATHGSKPCWVCMHAGLDQQMPAAVLDALAARFATVMPDCSDQQLARGLWALGTAR